MNINIENIVDLIKLVLNMISEKVNDGLFNVLLFFVNVRIEMLSDSLGYSDKFVVFDEASVLFGKVEIVIFPGI